MGRVYHDGSITFEDLQKLIADMQEEFRDEDIEKYEIGRELERGFKIDYGEDVRREIDSLPWFAANHLSLNYGRIIRQGPRPVAGRDRRSGCAGKRSAGSSGNITSAQNRSAGRQPFHRTLRCQAAGMQQARGRLQEAGARGNGGHMRGDHAASGTFLPRGRPVYLAAATSWPVFVGAPPLSFGRFDQYMREYYERDISSGVISKNEAKELLCCLWLKVNEPKMRTVQSMTLGGITPDGADAANT